MATIGLIGSGHIGSTVARLAVDAGHDVVLSNSRGPETLTDLVDELGPHARAATAAEAAAAGDIVVVTVPLKAYRDVPAADERAVAGAVFGQMMDVELELVTASRACRPGRRVRPGCRRRRRP